VGLGIDKGVDEPEMEAEADADPDADMVNGTGASVDSVVACSLPFSKAKRGDTVPPFTKVCFVVLTRLRSSPTRVSVEFCIASREELLLRMVFLL
jgi:hypothetical protein